jgi:hypothetical protein
MNPNGCRKTDLNRDLTIFPDVVDSLAEFCSNEKLPA